VVDGEAGVFERDVLQGRRSPGHAGEGERQDRAEPRAGRGRGGGYRIDTRRDLPPVDLTPGEVSALVAPLVAVGPYIPAAAQSALAKLLATLTPEPTAGGRSR